MTDIITGQNCNISQNARVGVGGDEESDPTVIGDDATIRSGTVIYQDVTIGDEFVTGHRALLREGSTLGDDVLVGTDVVIDGEVHIGSHSSLQTGAYVPQGTTVGDHVFFGPHAVVTNDPYPIREESRIEGAVIENHVSIGANATILPGIEIGEGSFVAAGALVDEDVPTATLALGTPARHRPLPRKLRGGNNLA